MHISLVAEPVLNLFGLAITNSVLTTWLLMMVVFLFGNLISNRLQLVPRGFQHIIEGAVEWLYGTTTSIIHDPKLANRVFPLLLTFFIFILIASWFGAIPGIGAIMITTAEGTVPLFRAPTSDITTTLALAIVSVAVTHYLGIQTLGLGGYLKKFFSWKSGSDVFAGLLELISEFTKLIAFTFRLFGNIFADEVLVAVTSFLVPYILPVPFMGLHLFTGFIQAYVFTILTAVFISLAVTSHDHAATNSEGVSA